MTGFFGSGRIGVLLLLALLAATSAARLVQAGRDSTHAERCLERGGELVPLDQTAGCMDGGKLVDVWRAASWLGPDARSYWLASIATDALQSA